MNLLGADSATIGNSDPALPVTIVGGSGTGGLFIRQGAVTLQNLNFQNCNATGGMGGDFAGGGMGAGGALFIDTATVILHNINFIDCSAFSGLGSDTPGHGGGGGLGGSGGSYEGGGGGYGGNGGNNVLMWRPPADLSGIVLSNKSKWCCDSRFASKWTMFL